MHDFAVLRQGPIAKIRHDSPYGCDAENLRGRGQSGAAFRDTVVKHRRHSGPDRHLVDLQPVGLFPDKFAKIVGQLENLEDAQPAAIAEAPAALTAARLLEYFSWAEAERSETRVFGEIGFGKNFG